MLCHGTSGYFALGSLRPLRNRSESMSPSPRFGCFFGTVVATGSAGLRVVISGWASAPWRNSSSGELCAVASMLKMMGLWTQAHGYFMGHPGLFPVGSGPA